MTQTAPAPMRIVILGLSLSSSWGNGHATTWRALIQALARRGHDIVFLERETPWYAAHRDLDRPQDCQLAFYRDLDELRTWSRVIRDADAVIVGSYVPDGVEVGRFVRDCAQGVVAFYDIDTPVTLAGLDRGETEYLHADQIRDYDVYFSFTGGPTLRRLETQYGSPAARALYCSADPGVHAPQETEPRWDLSYLGTYSADRQPILERLLIEPACRAPHLRFVVAGPQYPETIDWPANVERVEHVPPVDHTAFYAASRFTLNVTRADMAAAGFSPSVRLFEAAACATPILTDVWPGLNTIFEPGRDLLTVSDADAVLTALDLPEEVRRALGEAARRRVLEAHTPDHRARTVEDELAATRLRKAPAAPKVLPRDIRRPLSEQRILVAGGAGFLGSHLCDRLLAEGAEVVCVDNLLTGDLSNLRIAMQRPAFSFVEADIIQPLPRRLTKGRFDRVYNLACAASPPLYQADPEHTLLTSVIGTKTLLELAERNGARFLLTSTSEIYGDPHVHPQPETYLGNVNCTGPRACYDEGKRCAETLAFDYDRAGRGEVRVARIFNTYGPRLSAADGRVVSNLISQALADEEITVFGDGSQTRSFCYVDDMISGLIALMEHDGPQPGPINLGNPIELSVSQLVDVILDLTGSSSPVVQHPLPIDDPRRRRPDIARAAAVLGWTPTVALEDGLRATIRWFDEDRDRVRPYRQAALSA
jgi:nucleoside-diphosphate-sugar epimerase/spore maturation protein CgeB